MSNIFLDDERDRDVETAIMLDKAKVIDIGKAVAYTDGRQVFINTDENLMEILPSYNKGMLKWLLWHERMHMELKHHNRFFKYLSELKDKECEDEFHISKEEVNIIMDILVHDSLSKMFPELVETALTNLAQMRNRNSLGYTFKTFNLEDMLDEYSKYKNPEEDEKEKDGKKGKGKDEEEDSKDKDKKKKDGKGKPSKEKGHGSGGGASEEKAKEPEEDTVETPAKSEQEDEHDKTDWSKLEDIDSKEFITEEEAESLTRAANRLKNKKIKLARLTQKLNGLATTSKIRTYRIPSYIQVNKGIMMKGKLPGKTDLYLVFDASGSMGAELKLFKDIINKAIPQAMECPCEWFSGYSENRDTEKKCLNRESKHSYDYYKGKFKDIMPVRAAGGYADDGDRTIELCLEAEKKGYTPIGVTDGGGNIYEPDQLKQLKRTILVGSSSGWLEKAKRINPNIQIIALDED